jgi:hypothetical protein
MFSATDVGYRTAALGRLERAHPTSGISVEAAAVKRRL